MGTGTAAQAFVRAFLVCAAWALALESAPAQSLVFASYNLKNYLRMERVVGDQVVPSAPKPEPEIEAAIGIIRKIRPDVLGVIEIGDEEMLADLQRRLGEAGLAYPHREWVRGADPDRHIALLSQHPIVFRNSRDNIPFEMEDSQHRVGRGILDVSIQPKNSGVIRFVGAHLKSRRPSPGVEERTFRAKEAWQIRRHVESILSSSPHEKLLIFGDLNDNKNEYPIKLLIGSPGSPDFMRPLPLEDRNGECWTHYWQEADIYSRLDYILASPTLWPHIDMARSGISGESGWDKASDHRAIFTTIRLPEL